MSTRDPVGVGIEPHDLGTAEARERGRVGPVLLRVLVSWWAILVFAVPAIAVTVHQPYSFGPAIRSDGLGYHAWTRALLDGHISFCEYQDLHEVQAISEPQPITGRCPNRYAPGLAILRFPAMAPFTLANGGELRSGAEDVVNQVTGIIAGLVAVACVVAASRMLGVRDWVANGSAVVLAFGTGLFHYATADSSFTHVYSAAFVGLLLLYGVRRLLRPPPRVRTSTASMVGDAAIVCVLSAALIAIRLPSFLVLAALFGAAMVVVRVRRLGWRVAIPIIAGTGLAVGVVTIGQVAYNRYNFGVWTLSSYGEAKFIPDRFKQLAVLASFEKGFVTWYPVVIVVVIVALVARNWSGIGLLAAVTLPLVVLYGAWESWSLAGGFGHRGFVEVAPVFGVVLAFSAQRVSPGWRTASAVMASVAMLMALGLMAAYWNAEIGFYGIDRGQWVKYAVGSQSFPIVILRFFVGGS